MNRAIQSLLNMGALFFGQVTPERSPPPRSQQPVDGRTAALRALRAYLTSLVYYLPMEASQDDGPLVGRPKPFQLLPANFHLETPDMVQEQKYPSIAVLSLGDIMAEGTGFTPIVVEETRDRFGPNTALVRHHAHVEKIALEVWGSTEPELRSMIAGLETAFNPVEGRAGLLLKMRQYFDVTARFLMTGREQFNDNDSAKGRRHGQVKLAMDFHVVSLINVAPLQPRVQLSVGYDPQTGDALDLPSIPTPRDAIDVRRWSRAGRTVS